MIITILNAMVLISAHRTHTQSRNNVHAYPVITVFRTAYHPPPTTIHILNYHTKLCTPTTNNIVFIFKAVYNYVYLFTRYLLPENTSKLYSSLHTKQNTRLDFLLQISFNLLQ